MIRKLISRYQPKYVRSLVYMLQASEYNIRDYLSWYHRSSDFSSIEKRKHLVKTTKAKLFLVIGWLILITIYAISLYFLWQQTTALGYLIFILLLLAAPYILAYLFVLVMIALKAIQWPIEYWIVKKAQRKLKNHKGLKIAIAGSYGKTSMREVLKTVLSEGKNIASPPHSYNTPLGISQFIKGLRGDEDVLIFEFGEYYPGDVIKLCRIVNPEIGIITGVNEAHLQKFKSLDKTTSTIFELADWLKEKPVYVNAESQPAKKRASTKHILYSKAALGSLRVTNQKADLNGTSFSLDHNGRKLDFKSNLLGLHQIGALLVAIDIGFKLNLTVEQIQKGVAQTKPFEHRLEPKVDSSGIVTLDDSYNGNPDGVRAIIEFLALIKTHRRFYVTPGLVEMGSSTEEIHKNIGHQLANADIENVILIKNSVTPYIAQGLEDSGYKGKLIWFDDALKAFAALPQMTVKGDVVLLQNDWPDQYA